MSKPKVFLGNQYPIATTTRVERLLASPVSADDGRSEWMWFRLANGDLIVGFYPRGDAYMDCEVDFTEDWTLAERIGTERIIEADIEEVDPDATWRAPGPDDEQWVGYPRSEQTDLPFGEKDPDEQIDWLLRKVTGMNADVSQRRHDLEVLCRIVTENPRAGFGRTPIDTDQHDVDCVICEGREDFSLDPPGVSRDGHPYMTEIPAGTPIYVIDQEGATFAFAFKPHADRAAVDELASGAIGLHEFTVTAPRDGMSLYELAEYAVAHGPERPLAERLRARLREYDDTLATPGQAQDIAEADLLHDVRAMVELIEGGAK